MVKLKVVTGYVPISNHPRSAKEYGEFGEKLQEALAGVPVHPFYARLEDCWLQRYLKSLDYDVTPSVADNAAKNTLAYHSVQHEKFSFLAQARVLDPDSDVFVWMDYGIMGSIPGVTKQIVVDFLNRVRAGDFAIPGCWKKTALVGGPSSPWPEDFPCWRFCGGVFVVPQYVVMPLFTAVKNNVKGTITLTKNLSWEVNTLARMERAGVIRPRWYEANHDKSMFTGYK
jgi:hypothetical protein